MTTSTTTPTVQLYRISEVCNQLALSRSSIYREISSGNLRAVRIGKALRVSSEELARFAGGLSQSDNSGSAA